MKSGIILFLAAVFAVALTLPAPSYIEDQGDAYAVDGVYRTPEEVAADGVRFKRATCDATSFTSKWLTINHSACALHCLAKRFKGGYCKNTICHCRN